jgi:hypothetical protein
MKVDKKILQKQDTLKAVQSKLEAKRDALIDKINASLSSDLPNRVSIIYKTQLKLVVIEKALELNRFFMLQVQQEVLADIIADDMIKGTLDAIDKKIEGDKDLENNTQ